MAEPFDTLLVVQQHDIAIDQLQHRRAALPERAELAGIADQRATLQSESAELAEQVAGLAQRQAALEEQIAAAAKRRHDIEQRMLTGGISDARDLQAMDQETQHLAERQGLLEEQEIELLEEEEPLDVALAGRRAAVDELQARAVVLAAAVADAEAAIDREVAEETAARAARAAALPADLAQRYETLRSRLGGIGAARLVGDRCDGCHLTLPSVEVERVRNLPPDAFATCEQCGRILVH